MGTTPTFEDMPIDLGDFPLYIQYVFSLFNMLPDKWEGMSGTYMGKDYGILPFLFEMEDLDKSQYKEVFQFLQLIERAARKFYNEKQANERRLREASSKGKAKSGRSVKG